MPSSPEMYGIQGQPYVAQGLQVRRKASGGGRALRQAPGCGVLLGASTQPSAFAECKSLASQLLGHSIDLFWTVSDIGNGEMLLSGAVDALVPHRMGYFAFGIPAPGAGMVGGSALIFKQNSSSATRASPVLPLAAFLGLSVSQQQAMFQHLQRQVCQTASQD